MATATVNRTKFNSTKEEYKIIRRIAVRAQQVYKEAHGEPLDLMEVKMDLDATHSNGCPLDFKKLEGFDNFNLMHDIIGIANHIDRSNGKLTHCFLPRCSK